MADLNQFTSTESAIEFEYVGIVDGVTVTTVVICTPFLILSTLLMVWSTAKCLWRERDTPKKVWGLALCVSSSYYIGGLFGFLTFCLILSYGWDPANYHPAPQLCFYIFITFYLFAQLFTLNVWIQRLETTFQGSAYQFPSNFIKVLRAAFYFMILLIAVLLIVFLVADSQGEYQNGTVWESLLQISAILFSLLFIAELLTLSGAFLYKLVQLKRIVEHQQTSNDSEETQFIQSLVQLQIKLTILAITTIVSTFCGLFGAVVFDGYSGIVPMILDGYLGFFCIYCSLRQHQFAFDKVCIACIWCCGLCIHSPVHQETTTEQRRADRVYTASGVETRNTVSPPSDADASPAEHGDTAPVDDTPVGDDSSIHHSQRASVAMSVTSADKKRDSATMTASELPSNIKYVSSNSELEVIES